MRFKKVYLEITNTCNMACNFCPKTKRRAEFMTLANFNRVIESIKPYTNYVYLHLLGEPLLHPDLADFLECCQVNGLQVNITTNGTVLRKVQDTLLAAAALRKVSISLHSFEANEYQTDLREYLDSIVAFVKAASERTKIISELRLWNLDSDSALGSNQLNKKILTRLEKELGLDFSIRAKLTEAHRIQLGPRIFLELADKFAWPDLTVTSSEQKVFCYGLRDQIGVLVDGTVVPCCLDHEGDIPLGNIFTTPLGEILNSPRAKAIYEGFSRRHAVEELCRTCGYARRFK